MKTLHRWFVSSLWMWLLVWSLVLAGCAGTAALVPCMDKTSLLAEFTDADNTVYLLYQNGALYRERADRSGRGGRSGECEFVEQYFAPNFL